MHSWPQPQLWVSGKLHPVVTWPPGSVPLATGEEANGPGVSLDVVMKQNSPAGNLILITRSVVSQSTDSANLTRINYLMCTEFGCHVLLQVMCDTVKILVLLN